MGQGEGVKLLEFIGLLDFEGCGEKYKKVMIPCFQHIFGCCFIVNFLHFYTLATILAEIIIFKVLLLLHFLWNLHTNFTLNLLWSILLWTLFFDVFKPQFRNIYLHISLEFNFPDRGNKVTHRKNNSSQKRKRNDAQRSEGTSFPV